MIQKKPSPYRTFVDPAFEFHCSKIVNTVCAVCGGSDLSDVNHIENKGRCNNPQCESRTYNRIGCTRGITALAPSLEEIYGEEEHNIDYRQNKSGISGSGLQRDGKPSASSVMHAIRLAKPRSFQGDNTPGIHTWDMQREIEGTTVSRDSISL